MTCSDRRGENYARNLNLAKILWSGQIHRYQKSALRSLSEKYKLSVGSGDLQFLDGRWYVTHSGLIRLAERKRCAGITANPVIEFCDAASSRWVFKATVHKKSRAQGFCWIWGRRSFQCVQLDARSGDAHRRNPRRQPSPAKSLRYRPLLGRRTRVLLQ